MKWFFSCGFLVCDLWENNRQFVPLLGNGRMHRPKHCYLKGPEYDPWRGWGIIRPVWRSRDQSGVRLVPSLLRNLGETLALLYDFSRRWLHPIDGKWVNNLAFVRSAVLKNPFRGNSCNEEKVPAECSWDISKINIFLLLYIAILAPP